MFGGACQSFLFSRKYRPALRLAIKLLFPGFDYFTEGIFTRAEMQLLFEALAFCSSKERVKLYNYLGEKVSEVRTESLRESGRQAMCVAFRGPVAMDAASGGH